MEEIKGNHNYFFIAITALVAALSIFSLYYAGIIASDDFEITIAVDDDYALLSLIPDKGKYVVGDLALLEIVLNTNRQVDGADVIVEYDKNYLLPVESKLPKDQFENQASVYLTALSVKAFERFSKVNIDEDNSVVAFSALTEPGKKFKGNGSVAFLTFKILKPGTTEVSLRFRKGDSSDSNVAYEGKDILRIVKGAFLFIEE